VKADIIARRPQKAAQNRITAKGGWNILAESPDGLEVL